MSKQALRRHTRSREDRITTKHLGILCDHAAHVETIGSNAPDARGVLPQHQVGSQLARLARPRINGPRCTVGPQAPDTTRSSEKFVEFVMGPDPDPLDRVALPLADRADIESHSD